MTVEIIVDTSPNENALKYTVVGKQVIDKGHKTYNNAEEAGDCPVAQALFGIEGVTSVFLMADFVTVVKQPEAQWDGIKDAAKDAIASAYA